MPKVAVMIKISKNKTNPRATTHFFDVSRWKMRVVNQKPWDLTISNLSGNGLEFTNWCSKAAGFFFFFFFNSWCSLNFAFVLITSRPRLQYSVPLSWFMWNVSRWQMFFFFFFKKQSQNQQAINVYFTIGPLATNGLRVVFIKVMTVHTLSCTILCTCIHTGIVRASFWRNATCFKCWRAACF